MTPSDAASTPDAVPTPALSLQLYSVREALAADLEGTLDRIAAAGFGHLEAFDIVALAPALAAATTTRGLTVPTAHAPLLSREVVFLGSRTVAPTHDEVFDAAAELGARLVIDPLVQPDRWTSLDDVKRTAERLNAASETARARGLSVGYHNHSHEFHHSFDGVSAYESFVAELEDGVALEVDAYWAHVGGQDVAALVQRLGRRVKAVHIKDGTPTADAFRTLDFSPETLRQVPAGRGEVPLAAVLAAGAGIEYAVVEYDAVSGDLFEAIDGSVAYLAAQGITG